MTLRHLLRSTLALPATLGLCLHAACAAPVPGPEVTLGSVGKGDTDTVGGGELRSDFAEEGKHYIQRRRLENLREVEAFSAEELAMARRADGIIASQPNADGWLTIYEIDRYVEERFNNSLFPGEQAVFRELWSLMEAPEDRVAVNLGELTTIDDVEERLPEAPTLPSCMAITEAPEASRLSLQRLQLQFDSDSDPGTVCLEDIEGGLADEQQPVYLPTEIDHFQEARTQIARLRASVPSGAPTLVVPGLGVRTQALENVGDAELELVRRTYLAETTRYGANGSGDWLSTMRLHHEADLNVTVPTDGKVLILNSPGEEVLYPGTQTARWTDPQLIVEVWQDGERSAHAWVDIPRVPRAENIHQYIGYRFEDEEGNEVVRQEQRLQNGWGQNPTTTVFTGAVPRVPGAGSLNTTTTLHGEGSTLTQWGRYEVEDRGHSFVVEMYEGPVMPIIWITVDGGERLRATQRRGLVGESVWTAGVTRAQYSRSYGTIISLGMTGARAWDSLSGNIGRNSYIPNVPLDGLLRVR